MVFSYILFKFANIYACIVKNLFFYFGYIVFFMRNIVSGNTHYIDYRYNRDHEQYVYPFLHVCEISFLDRFDNEVLVSDATYENIRNVGLYICDNQNNDTDNESNDTDNETNSIDNDYVEYNHFNDIKKFCRVPNSVNSIKGKNYPWIKSSHHKLVIDESNSLKSICESIK